MAGRVIYLDVDDEITSGAARIRAAEVTRVAVVLPYGSRVATSRINFRLLARDAMTNGKILSVVAADPATRALAASAGLPVFSTAAEYESSLEGAAGDAAAGPAAATAAGAVASGPGGGVAAAGAIAAAGGLAALGGAAGDEPMLVSETVATPSTRPRGRRQVVPDAVPEATDADGTNAAAIAAVGAAAVAGGEAAVAGGDAAAAAAAISGASAPGAAESVAAGEVKRPARTPAAIPAARVVADTPATTDVEREPVRPRTDTAGSGRRWSIGRTPLVVGLAVLALALVVAGAGAFLFLPSATAVVTPRQATVGPASLRIVASTTATEPDPATLTVPARQLTVPLEASDSFPATGKRIEETNAKGAVRFDNLDPTSSNSIQKGSIVSTSSGVRFRTDKAITVRPAELVGLTIVPSHASVNVTAVDAGPDGNVEPNAIRTVPRGEEPFFLKVTNPEATTGGSRTEFPRVTQDDVDKAAAALTAQLTAAFDDRLDDPDLPGDAATVFPETKTLEPPVFSVELAKLVGQEVEAFDLVATSSGTVVAVDTTPVQAVAEARIRSSVTPGYVLIDGSGQVDPAPAEVSGGVITFPVVVTARQQLVLDAEAIKQEIMGKPLAQAREILATYGESDLTVWPDWVGTVPTIDSRVEVNTPQPEVSPEPEASP